MAMSEKNTSIFLICYLVCILLNSGKMSALSRLHQVNPKLNEFLPCSGSKRREETSITTVYRPVIHDSIWLKGEKPPTQRVSYFRHIVLYCSDLIANYLKMFGGNPLDSISDFLEKNAVFNQCNCGLSNADTLFSRHCWIAYSY